MEKLSPLLIPGLLGAAALRLLLTPMKLIFKLAIHAAGGFLSLWLLNTVSQFTGVVLPINAVTVVMAGIGGIPGIGLIAVLEFL